MFVACFWRFHAKDNQVVVCCHSAAVLPMASPPGPRGSEGVTFLGLAAHRRLLGNPGAELGRPQLHTRRDDTVASLACQRCVREHATPYARSSFFFLPPNSHHGHGNSTWVTQSFVRIKFIVLNNGGACVGRESERHGALAW